MLLLTSLLILEIFSKLIDCRVVGTDITNIRDLEVIESNKLPGLNYSEDHLKDLRYTEAVTAAVLTIPSSRAYKCFLGGNSNCNIFKSNGNAGTIINSKDFLRSGPQDGEIASAGNSLYSVLDEHRIGRWRPSRLKMKEHNATYFNTEIEWLFNKELVVVDEVNVFLSNSKYKEDEPIRKSSFNLACSHRGMYLVVERNTLRLNCYIRYELVEDLLYETRGSGLLLSTLKTAGSDYAFYQIADISLHEPASRIVTLHGYVSSPLSRAKLCQLRVNKKCGLIMYEPQSVEGFKGFPYAPRSPPDGTIASANNVHFKELNEYGADRWTRTPFPDVNCLNQTHVSFDITWYFSAVHKTDKIEVFINNENYTSTEPLSRRHLYLDPLCTVKFWGQNPPWVLNMICPISLEKYQRLSALDELLLLSVWSVYDTSFAFYQVMDLQGLPQEQSYESLLQKCQ